MVADVIVARHKRGAITRISLCFISCSLNETTCKTYKTTQGKTASSPAAVTNGGPVVVGHTTPPTSSRQRPKVLNLSVFLTISDGSRRSNELAPSPMAGYEIVSGWTFRGLSG